MNTAERERMARFRNTSS